MKPCAVFVRAPARFRGRSKGDVLPSHAYAKSPTFGGKSVLNKSKMVVIVVAAVALVGAGGLATGAFTVEGPAAAAAADTSSLRRNPATPVIVLSSGTALRH